MKKKYLEILNELDRHTSFVHSIEICGDFSGRVIYDEKEVLEFSNEKELVQALAYIKAGIEFDKK